jgi:hypothetical protein
MITDAELESLRLAAEAILGYTCLVQHSSFSVIELVLVNKRNGV